MNQRYRLKCLLVGMVVIINIGIAHAQESEILHSAKTLLPSAALSGKITQQDHPYADQMNRFSNDHNKCDFVPTGLTRNHYLDVISGQIKTMRRYQDDEGRIHDPVWKGEWYYSTPCYAYAVAVLIQSGLDTSNVLIESGMKALDVSLIDLVDGVAPKIRFRRKPPNNSDFYMYPVMLAYQIYRSMASCDRVKKWNDQLSQLEAPDLYVKQSPDAHNWGVANATGDYLRAFEGFTTDAYAQEMLGYQKNRFTPSGLYVENGNPFAYDHFSRYLIGGMLYHGYQGQHRPFYRDYIWRGAWTSLFMLSPAGEAPTGHRSSHHIWNEAQSASTFEMYATLYARAGMLNQAGAFKRAARLSLQSILNWIRSDGTGHIVKNRYPIESLHGYEYYSVHTTYNLLACSMLAQAWQFANDSIEEQPAPCDKGGYVISVENGFNTVFASACGNYIEYNTYGDLKYNPTGLIRLHLSNGHPQLGPSDGCSTELSGRGNHYAVGPLWKDKKGVWHSLAEKRENLPTLKIIEENSDKVVFSLSYQQMPGIDVPGSSSEAALIETITIDSNGVTVEDRFQEGSIRDLHISYPMLIFDGLSKTSIEIEENQITLLLNEKRVQFEILESHPVHLERTGRELVHRNGMVEIAYAFVGGYHVTYRIH